MCHIARILVIHEHDDDRANLPADVANHFHCIIQGNFLNYPKVWGERMIIGVTNIYKPLSLVVIGGGGGG